MARIGLQPGENNIANCQPKDLGKTPGKRGHTWTLQWHANINGETKRYFTKVTGASKTDCYRAAHSRFKRLLEEEKLPGEGKWTGNSHMADFIVKICIPAVEANKYAKPLRPGSQRQYLICLRHYAEQVGKMSIKNAIVPATMEKHFKAIAVAHGNPTAKQSAKVASKYVMDVLVHNRVIDHNPLRPRTIEVTVAERVDEPDAKKRGGHALLPEEHRRVIEHLLSLDPKQPARRGHSEEVMTAKRSNVIDATLLQATCGMRIGEVRQMRSDWLGDDGNGHLTITVPANVSKTHRGRTIPVLNEDVAERIRKRFEKASRGQSGLIFPAPESGGVWDSSNAQKAVRRLYDELADTLDIPLLREARSHVWRTTLNSEWADLGVSAERRAAYFGHSPEINRQAYTDLVDLTELVNQIENDS